MLLIYIVTCLRRFTIRFVIVTAFIIRYPAMFPPRCCLKKCSLNSFSSTTSVPLGILMCSVPLHTVNWLNITLFVYFMLKKMSFISTNIHNFITMIIWATGDYMREISFGQSKVTDHTVTPCTIGIQICPCAYRVCTQMVDV
jgi:hypothetical protein